MKKIAVSSFLLLVLGIITFAQERPRVELSPYTGWMLAGKSHGYYADITFRADQNWGVAASIFLSDEIAVEFNYNRLDHSARIYDYIEKETFDEDLVTSYYQIGGLRHVDLGKVRPYGLVSMGLTVFTPKSRAYDEVYRFGFNAGGGVKIYLTEHIGIRLQARLLMPVYFQGLGIFVGTGGASAGASLGATVVQGDFTGGLVLAF